jgi:cell division septum initiation protein DivIVA
VADLATLLERLEELVTQAKAMPLSSSVLLNREELLASVREMQQLLPEEVRQAKFIVKDREELLAKARERADEIVAEGRAAQAELLRDEAIARAAQDESIRILADAEEQAHRVRREADDYVDTRLEQLESVLRRAGESFGQAGEALESATLQVTRGRRHLRGEPQE